MQAIKLIAPQTLLFNLKKKRRYIQNPCKTRHHKIWLELTLALPGVAQESQREAVGSVFLSAVG